MTRQEVSQGVSMRFKPLWDGFGTATGQNRGVCPMSRGTLIPVPNLSQTCPNAKIAFTVPSPVGGTAVNGTPRTPFGGLHDPL